MNKMMVIIAVVITGILINSGLVLNTKMLDTSKQKEQLMSQNISMADEIEQKQTLKKSSPRAILKSFAMFINQLKVFEIYGGTRMKIVFSDVKDNENIEDRYIETAFRNVKALPLTISVDKFSDETDKVEVLNDIYLLESRSDFKVSEISTGNNGLIVKGELYGI